MSASEWFKTNLILGYEYNAEEDCVVMRKKNGKVRINNCILFLLETCFRGVVVITSA